MIEQLNTIDYDDEEFVVNFYDGLLTYKAWTVKVLNMRNSGRPYWWRCGITYDVTDGIPPTNDQQVVQHFFAPTYQALKAQIIDFIAKYFY